MGLKENVILGHLIPAGTGFRTHQEAEVRLNTPDGGEPERPAPARGDGAAEKPDRVEAGTVP